MSINLLHTRSGGRLFHVGPLFIAHDCGPITHEAVREDFNAIELMVEQYESVSFLRVFEAHLVGRPTSSVIRAVELRLEALRTRRLCSALVVRGTGLAPVWMRAAMRDDGLITGDAKDRALFDNLGEGLAWLQRYDGQDENVKNIELAALEQALSGH